MEPLWQKLAWILALVPLIFTGCVSMRHVISPGDDLPMAPVCQIATTWTNQVIFTPDPVHDGAPTPGIAGRLYLFDKRGFPVVGDGTATIELYDDSAKTKGGEAKLLELWKFNNETLRLLLSRDTIGWGYSLFLPWGTYSPAITAVHLKVRYAPPQSIPIYNESGTVTLNSKGNSSIRSEARTVVPNPEKGNAVTKR